MNRKILICGLPGAGKTELAKVLAKRLGAVHFNADAVRANINKDLGFSPEDRIEQARRMGWLCDQVVRAGGTAIADFVCPTAACRLAFNEGGKPFMIWVNRIKTSRYPDTDAMFQPPPAADIEVVETGSVGSWAEIAAGMLVTRFDPAKPTALFVGRYQPFHDGHRALVIKGIEQVGQACIAVRTMPQSARNPFAFVEVKERIESALATYRGRFCVVQVPNIEAVLYGRDVGYRIERVELDERTEAISGTGIRASILGQH